MYLGLTAYIIGVVLSVLVPYLLKWLEDKTIKFDWRYIIGRLLVAALALVPVLASPGFIETLSSLLVSLHPLTFFFSLLSMGWGASEIGWKAQSAGELRKT